LDSVRRGFLRPAALRDQNDGASTSEPHAPPAIPEVSPHRKGTSVRG